MNAPSSNTTPVSLALYTQSVAKTNYVQDTDKLTLKKAIALEAERRHEENQSVEKQAKKRIATLRSIRSDKRVRSSKQEAAALELTRALGLSSKETKALFTTLEKPGQLTAKAEKALKKATTQEMIQLLKDPQTKALLEKIKSALESEEPLKTLNLSPESFEVFTAEIMKPTDSNTARNFAKAMGEAEGMIQVLIGQNAATAGILAKFESEFEALKSQVSNNLIADLKADWAHYQHEEHKMKALGIVKKVLGSVIAAILGLIGAITGNMGLIAVAVLVVATTWYPPLMDKICEFYARDMLQLKGAAAEAVSLTLRILIATLLTVFSGGEGGASMIGNLATQAGSFSSMVMLTGGAEAIGNLEVDAQNGCDVYRGKATDAEKDKAAYEAQKASYVFGGIALGGMLLGGISSLRSSSETAPATVKAPTTTEDEPVVEGTPDAVTTEDTTDTVQDILDESEETEEANKSEKGKELKAAKQRRLLNYAQFGLASSTATDGGVSIEIGALRKQMADTIEAIGIAQANLTLHQDSINKSTKQMKTEETSTQATTSQAIDELQNMTDNIGAACAHQIVGATSA